MTTKYEDLLKYSNPQIVAQRLEEYLPGTQLYISSRANKKYMVQNKEGKLIHFGQMGYEDFTNHRDPVRRDRYLKRAMGIKGKWRLDEYSPNALSIVLLW
jgi:hypothetical protein